MNNSFARNMGRYLSMSLERSREGHLGLVRQLGEMTFLSVFYRVGPGYYHKAQMYKRDMPFSSKMRYRLGRHYRALVNRYNNPAYHKLSQNKIAEKAILSTFRIPTPRLYGYYHPDAGLSTDGKDLRCPEDFDDLVLRHNITSLAIKNVEGYEGRGFDIVDFSRQHNGTLVSRVTKGEMSTRDYLSQRNVLSEQSSLLLEDVIIQHPLMASLNESSINTLRMWVTRLGAESRIRSVMQKVGSPGSLVDYVPGRGAAVPVDIDSGRLGQPRLRGENSIPGAEKKFSRLAGFEIPYFREACVLAEKTLSAFPEINFAGMDIAISEDGPLVVELNVIPDPGHAATMGIPILDLLEPLPESRRD